MSDRQWWVYVIQSLEPRKGKRGRPLPGFHYVGATTDVFRRLREHNGIYANGSPGNPKGGKYTSRHRPWEMKAIHGPYENQSEAMRAERSLKKGKRGVQRTKWAKTDSKWCRGMGSADPRVSECNEALSAIRQKHAATLKKST